MNVISVIQWSIVNIFALTELVPFKSFHQEGFCRESTYTVVFFQYFGRIIYSFFVFFEPP